VTKRHAVLELTGVGVVRDRTTILHNVSLRIDRGERWIVIGPNGGGKSTLVGVASLSIHPSSGSVRLLGTELGKADIRPLRGSVGVCSALLAHRLRPELAVHAVVYCGKYGALEPWWHTYTHIDEARASELLEMVGLGGHDRQHFGLLSSGERQRALLARSLFNDPELLLLDEPNAGLDPGAREALIEVQDELAGQRPDRATVLVTHHVEDIPTSATHLLAIDRGAVVAKGPLEPTLTGALISDLFGVRYELRRHARRWIALPDRQTM
jgi:iron complex transport system ATP-binding protein